MLPCLSQPTTTTFMPAMTALAGFVPCALLGIRQTFRWASPRCVVGPNHHQAHEFTLGSRLGCGKRSKPCDFGKVSLELGQHGSRAAGLIEQTEWCNSAKAAVIGINSVAAFNFMVHDPAVSWHGSS